VLAVHQSRGDLPRGTVTMLFADVEGSTRLLYALGQRFEPARARLREIVRESTAAHGGHEVDWAGDGVFLVFPGARDAIVAAFRIQRELDEEAWPAEHALRLRMGLHTGEPDSAEDGYVGADVVIAARICAAAHGGQVVVSRATRDVVGTEPFPGASYRPLGLHRLKDIPAPEQLFQLAAPGLEQDFPPLRTLGAASLPALHHRLVGRDDALERIGALLHRSDVRLVTVTGPGGTGKSRLGLEVAASAALERPVHLVGLAPIAHVDLVPGSIARAISVRESPSTPLLQGIAEALDGTHALLFLDNLEHLAPAATYVAELLDQVPDLDVLVTSRAPLQLSGEHVLPLEPLSEEDAATLLTELAAARGVVLQPDALASVHEICRRLDGLPLAIELVAARLVVLPPAEILRALDEGLVLEMEGPVNLPERQRTLRSAIDWSYDLLSDAQRSLHGALAVFVNGCAIDHAREVSGAGTGFIRDLEALVAWSLVRSEVTDGDLRLTMLQTVREHAIDRLAAAGRLEEFRRRHAEHFLALALVAEEGLEGSEQRVWAERLERDLDNIRTALDWLLTSGRAPDAVRATSSLERFWRANAHLSEARRRLQLGLELASDLPAADRALALRHAAHMAMGQSDWDSAAPLLEEAIRLFEENGDAGGQVVALGYLGFVALRQGNVGRARDLGDQALSVATGLGDERAMAVALMALGDIAWIDGAYERAIADYTSAVEMARRVGDPLLIVSAVYNLGMAAFQGGNVVRARVAFDEALALGLELREAPHTAAAHFMLAELGMLSGDASTAGGHALESLSLYTSLEDDRSRARCLVVLAGVAEARGELDDAARLLGAANGLRGAEAPDEFERPVLERLVPELASRLGLETFDELFKEGANLDPAALGISLVTSGSEE
jgi:predicted ATPase/class 3 adenylate cyclase